MIGVWVTFFAISRQMYHKTFYLNIFSILKKKTSLTLLPSPALITSLCSLCSKTSLKNFPYLRSSLHLPPIVLSRSPMVAKPQSLPFALDTLNTASLKHFPSWLPGPLTTPVFLQNSWSLPLSLFCWFFLLYLNSKWWRALGLGAQISSLLCLLSSPRWAHWPHGFKYYLYSYNPQIWVFQPPTLL